MGGQGSVHRSSDHPEVVLFLDHELFECLHRRLLLSSFGINYVFRIVVGSTGIT